MEGPRLKRGPRQGARQKDVATGRDLLIREGGRGAVDIPWLQTQLSSIRGARAAAPSMPGSAPRYPVSAHRFGLCSSLHVVGGPNKVGALIVTHVTSFTANINTVNDYRRSVEDDTEGQSGGETAASRGWFQWLRPQA